MKISKEKKGVILIFLSAVISLAVLAGMDPISQDPLYHVFSDSNTIAGILNALNVLSNIPYLLVGILGLYKSFQPDTLKVDLENKLAYIIFFFGILLVASGSGYYHLFPDNQTLVWDRLPMAVAFMSLVSIIIGEFISVKLGRYLLLPLLILGLFSVIFWYYTESNGVGDLRIYAFVQYYPVLVMPIILLFFNARYSHTGYYWLLFGTYALAKVFEYFDHSIDSFLVVISGHSLKHVISAAGLYLLLKSYEKREKIQKPRMNAN